MAAGDEQTPSDHAPLIDRRASPISSRDSLDDSDHDDPLAVSSSALPVAAADANRTGSNRAIYLLTLTAGLSGLLFGYDTGIISSTLLYLPLTLPLLSTTEKSLITSSTSLFALLASPLACALADIWGRRPLIFASCALFALGALLQSLAGGVALVVVGRSVVGVAVGGASAVVPLYVSEIAPADMRGRLVTVQSLFVTGGQVVAYVVGWACGERWRLAVGLGAVPALGQALLMGGLVESPRFLVLRGRSEEAGRVLDRLGVSGNGRREVLRRICEEVAVEKGRGDVGWWSGRAKELLGRGGNRRALAIACLLQGLQQLCGFNVLMYFSATIFSLVGFDSPVATSLSVAGTNFLFTLFAFSLIDSVGRRRILLVSIPFMVLGLALCSTSFACLGRGGHSSGHDLLGVSSEVNSSSSSSSSSDGSTLPIALLVSLILYVAAYALGLGCVPWQQSELFPLNVRSLGSGIATATNWSSNFVVGISFLPMMEVLGSSSTFAMYAGVCFVGWFLVYFLYPETAGLELEDVEALLADGWGVKKRAGLLRPRRHADEGHVRIPEADEA